MFNLHTSLFMDFPLYTITMNYAYSVGEKVQSDCYFSYAALFSYATLLPVTLRCFLMSNHVSKFVVTADVVTTYGGVRSR